MELPPALGWGGLTQQCICWFRVPDTEFYLPPRECDDLSLYAGTAIPASHAPPSTFYKKEAKWNNRGRGGMKSVKLKESQHQRVISSSSLNSVYNSGCYDNMIQLCITMTIWHNFQKTVSAVLFCCSTAPKETWCYLLLWRKLYCSLTDLMSEKKKKPNDGGNQGRKKRQV